MARRDTGICLWFKYTNLLCNRLENLNHNVLQGIFHREEMFGRMAKKLQIRIAGQISTQWALPASVKVTPGITSSLRLEIMDWKNLFFLEKEPSIYTLVIE